MFTTAGSRQVAAFAILLLALGALAFARARAAQAAGTTNAVLAWGLNGNGQLGDGATKSSDLPVKAKLPTGTKAVAAAAGVDFSLARTSTGAVLAWGDNAAGELGDGTTNSSDLPVKVKLPMGTAVTEVAAGYSHSLALTSTGAVLAWGDNTDGELGNGTMTNSDVPVKVKLPKGTAVTEVAAGAFYSLALTSGGSVLAWGNNTVGQLGNGTMTNSDLPFKVALPTGIKAVALAAGGYYALALTSTGVVFGWGGNPHGQLGDGTVTGPDDCGGEACSTTPVEAKVVKGTKVTAVAAGYSHSLALTSTGAILAWGYNLNGELGDGTTSSSDLPVKVKLPSGTKAVSTAAGAFYSVARTSTGALLSWGSGADGTLGDGSFKDHHLPVKVKLPTGDEATAVGAGSNAFHCLAVVHHV